MWICPVHDQPPAAKSGEAGKCDGWPHSLECGNQNHYMCDYQTCKCTLHEFNRKPAEDAVDLHLERILHEIQKELILKKPDTDIWNYGGFKEMLKELVSLARASRSRGL